MKYLGHCLGRQCFFLVFFSTPACLLFVQAQASGRCSNNPCRNGGSCTDLTNAYNCTCAGRYTGSSCEYKLPGSLQYPDCPAYVGVGVSYSCTCTITDEGIPSVTLQWISPGSTGSGSKILNFVNVERADDGKEFVCQYTWVRPSQAPVIKSITYVLRIAYGPTDNETRIEGPTRAYIDEESKPITLTCSSRNTVPAPLVEWTGVSCDGGNSAPTCIFTPDPILHHSELIRCTLKNPFLPQNVAKAQLNLTITWTGGARVLSMEVEDAVVKFSADASNKPLILCCLAAGEPTPSLHVYSVLPDGATRLLREYEALVDGRKKNRYRVSSPACQETDVYRCQAVNEKGNDSRTVSVFSDCTPEKASESFKMTVLYFMIIPLVIVLVAAAVVTFMSYSARRRWRLRTNLAKMESAFTQGGGSPNESEYSELASAPDAQRESRVSTSSATDPTVNVDGVDGVPDIASNISESVVDGNTLTGQQ